MYPAEATALAGELSDRTLVYLTGSHFYGLSTPESDKDYTLIYFDPEDDRRVFRQHPEVKHSAGNDHKLYSLRKFASLVAVGNPNVVEIVAHGGRMLQDGWHEDGSEVRPEAYGPIFDLLSVMHPHLVTRHLLAAYVGHVSQVHAEMTKKGVTPKRLSHAVRLAACALEVIREPGAVPNFRQLYWHDLAFDLKTGGIAQTEGEEKFQSIYGDLLRRYHGDRPELPDSGALRHAINDFFVRL